MDSVKIRLSISTREFSRLYRGEARDVICSAEDGRVVQFPACHLRQFLTHDGIHGQFEVFFSTENRFIKIKQNK